MSEWTSEQVIERFEEAARTLRRLPPVKAQGYFSTWPKVKYTELELLQQEAAPLRLGPPTAEAISRMEEALSWLAWLTPEGRKLVWLRAERLPWKPICMRLGTDRTTAWRWYKRAITVVVRKLNG